MSFTDYRTGGFYDELFEADGVPRASARPLLERIQSLTDREIARRQKAAETALREAGITFTVYGDRGGTERIFPFDIIPRIVEARDWAVIEAGFETAYRGAEPLHR